MTKNILFLLFILFSIGFLFTMCSDDYDCAKSTDFGKIIFSDSTKSFFLPLIKKKGIYYKDSLGKDLLLNIQFDSTEFSEKWSFNGYKGCPDGYYKVKEEEIYITLISSENNLMFYFVASMHLDGPYDTAEHREDIYLTLNKPDTLPRIQYFNDTSYRNTRNYPPAALKHTNVTLFGKEYKNVIIDKKITPTMCYLDKKVGIRAFRDFDNKLWVFDRFE